MKTASGATAVQIVGKRHGVRTTLEISVSVHDEAELAALMRIGQDMLHANQPALTTIWRIDGAGVGGEGVSAGLDDVDGALGAGGSGEAAIPGEQGHVECFGEGDVGGVVDGEVVPQLPTTGQQWGVAHALDGQFPKVIKSECDAAGVQVAAAGQPSPHRGHLESMSVGAASCPPRMRFRVASPSAPSSSRATGKTSASMTSTVELQRTARRAGPRSP